jgi:fatty acid desaturase
MITKIEEARLEAVRERCLAQEWQLPTEQPVEAPQSRREVRELVAVALWLLGVVATIAVLLWVGR